MSVYPKQLGRDPLETLEWAERQSCRGCRYLGKMLGKEFCEHPSRNGKADKRCKSYTTTEED